MFSGIMTIVSFFGIGDEDLEISTIVALLVPISLLLLPFQLIFTVLFSSKKIAIKFQKLYSVFLSCIAFKLSIDMYQIFFVYCDTRFTSSYFQKIGLILLFGGILFLVFSTLRAVKRVKQGELRNNGKGLYDFQNFKGYVSVPIIFGVTMLGAAAGRYFSDMSTDITVLIALLFCVVLQYSLALALPEFFLVTYCKFRFESFKVK
jgi:uncharacterized membrane protein YidH (DUF202 family)